MKTGGLGINRPAYNEMTGALAAFFLSNLARIQDHPERVYGWLVPSTFYERNIEDFKECRRNIRLALPLRRAFLLGTFNGERFWSEAPRELHEVALHWFGSRERDRNVLISEHLARLRPELQYLAEQLFEFEIVDSDES